MCDFRKIERITLYPQGITIDTSDYKFITWQERRDSYKLDLEPGLYYIGASGAYYQFYNGEHWIGERPQEYYVVEERNLQNTLCDWVILDNSNPIFSGSHE